MSKKAGRPPKDSANKRDARLSVRISTALRNKLEDVQREADDERSLSEEVELRLRESFEMDREIEKRFGGPATARLLEMIAERVVSIETSTGGTEEPGGPARLRWFNDRFTYDQVRSMIDVIFDHFKPGGRRTIPKTMRWHPSLRKDVENLGRHSALLALACLESAKNDPKRIESDVPVLYDKAALPLGRRLKGSPIGELHKVRQQTRRRILARDARVKALVAYLTPALTKNGPVSKERLVESLKKKGIDDKIARKVVRILEKSGSITATGEQK